MNNGAHANPLRENGHFGAADIDENKSKPSTSLVPAVSEYFDGSPVPSFAIDLNHVVTQWNKACERVTGIPADCMVGTSNHWQAFYKFKRPTLADLLLTGELERDMERYYGDKCSKSELIPGAYEVQDYFPQLGESGRWLHFSAAPLRDGEGKLVGAIEVLQDVTSRKNAETDLYNVQLKLEELVEHRTSQLAQANAKLEEDIRRRETIEAELVRRNAELMELNTRLSHTQQQLLQSEKMASIGQLAAGVAHEINNPVGYTYSNFNALQDYISKLFDMLHAYEAAEPAITSPETLADLKTIRERIELDYLKEDIPVLMAESREGLVRVRKIVQDLKDFSRADVDASWQWTSIHQGIESTLNIVNNEVKYKADVVKDFGELPDIECLPSQLNQVILNLVVNAAQAMGGQRGVITIRTGTEGDYVWITVSDTGSGIPKDILPRIFDPFFTTKPIGSGTGLGLSISYGIIQKHNGTIEVESEVGRGTTFHITLPIRHNASSDDKGDVRQVND